MPRSPNAQIAFAFLAGGLLAILSSFLLAYTVAIALPGWLASHPLTVDNTAEVLRLWDTFVVYLLAVGAPGFAIALALFKFSAEPKWLNFTGLLAGFLVSMHFLPPLLWGGDILVPAFDDIPWYAALLGNLIIGTLAALLLMRRISYIKGINPDAGKFHAV